MNMGSGLSTRKHKKAAHTENTENMVINKAPKLLKKRSGNSNESKDRKSQKSKLQIVTEASAITSKDIAQNALETPKKQINHQSALSPSYKQSVASTASARYTAAIQTPINAPTMSEQSSKSIESNEIVVASRFKLIKKLGKGSFGVTYEALDLTSNKHIALKLERKRESSSSSREIPILEKAGTARRVPALLWNGSYKQYRAMAMELQGPNLCTLFEMNDRTFSLKSVVHIAIEIMVCMEQLHQRGIVHRDIKPQNFIVGLDNPTKIYVIDFGLSAWFINCVGQHILYQENCSPVGTARYASLNNHRGIHQTRRDDLESIGYMLVYFLKGELPWQGLRENDRVKKWKKIEMRKASVSTEVLTQGLPHEFCYYIDYVKKLKYDERPDYFKLRKVFRKLWENCNFKDDGLLDWTTTASNQNSNKQ